VNVIIVGLHAEIVGSPERSVSNSNFITLNASLSFNPNEPENRQNQDKYYYIWRCDVEVDDDNCKEYTTTSKKNYTIAFTDRFRFTSSLYAHLLQCNNILGPIRKLPGFLNKAKKYEFNLITRVSDEYVKRVGKPKDGTAKIILFPNAIVLNIRIK